MRPETNKNHCSETTETLEVRLQDGGKTIILRSSQMKKSQRHQSETLETGAFMTETYDISGRSYTPILNQNAGTNRIIIDLKIITIFFYCD